MARPTNDELNALKEELEGLIETGGEFVTKLEKSNEQYTTAIGDIQKKQRMQAFILRA